MERQDGWRDEPTYLYMKAGLSYPEALERVRLAKIDKDSIDRLEALRSEIRGLERRLHHLDPSERRDEIMKAREKLKEYNSRPVEL